MNKMRAGATCGFAGRAAALRHQRSGRVRSVVALIAKGLCFCLLAASFTPHQAAAADDAARLTRRANFEREGASHEARHVADWVVHAGDNHAGDNRSLPFVIVDKTEAKVFVFDAHGRLRGAAPALLGLARGDEAVPGIGDREMSSIRPEERTTPAGRFVAALGLNMREDVLWVDYGGAMSMHRVVTTKPEERRLQRLATPTPLDNRISYGCINIPAEFYDNVVRPAFSGTNGIVYVLPETRLAREVFASYDVEEHVRLKTASQLDPERLRRSGMPIALAPAATTTRASANAAWLR